MKKPVILKNDLVLVAGALVFSTVGMFAAYRFGRKAEIDEIIDIIHDQGSTCFKFHQKNPRKAVKVFMHIIEGD